MQRSTQSRVLMELALIRIAHLDHFHQISTLLEQLRSGQATQPLPSVKPVQRAIAPPSYRTAPREKIGLTQLDDQRAKSIWLEAAESIDGALGSTAMKCKTLRFEKPNIFVAVFDNKSARDSCEKGSAQLQNALSQFVGEAVKIRFGFVVPADQSSPQADREQYLAAKENPFVLKIQETFGVTLHEVKR
jgi:hypothetical protein